MAIFGELDAHLFASGSHSRLWERMGAHLVKDGVRFSVWAPNAREVSVISSRNGWQPVTQLSGSDTGVWEGLGKGFQEGDQYKYRIINAGSGEVLEKADPFAFCSQLAPDTASVVKGLDYKWGDDRWLVTRKQKQSLGAPMSIYEVHL